VAVLAVVTEILGMISYNKKYSQLSLQPTHSSNRRAAICYTRRVNSCAGTLDD
jgi:hypothetical protein